MVQPSTSRARSARSKSQPKSKPKRPSLTVKIPIPPRARRARSSTVASSGASTDDSDMPRTPSPIAPLPNLPEVVVSNTPEKLGGVGDGLVSGVDALGLDFDVCLPPPPSSPKGPVCYEKTRTLFMFAGHLNYYAQWPQLHQAIVTYMYALNMSPQVVFHTHREGMFRGIEQKHTALTIITGSTWTNVFENDMQNLIRMVWQGGDRQIEVHRMPLDP